MASTINADTSNGLVLTPDTSGEIKLQAGGADIATVTSSGITMASGKTLPASALTGTLPAIDGSNLTGVGSPEYKLAEATTSTNRTLNASGSWVTHLTNNFTTTVPCTVICQAQAVFGYESGSCNVEGRFNLDGSTTSTVFQIFSQLTGNKAGGPHSMFYIFENVSAGSHSITWEVRNQTATAIMNYWGNIGGVVDLPDVFHCYYK